MLRNRSRAVTSKQALMADHHTNGQKASPSPSQTRSKTPSFFGSPKFKAFTQKGLLSDTDALVSPTSILDTKPFFSLTNPFSRTKHQRTFHGNKHRSWDEKPEAQGITLVLNDPFDRRRPDEHQGRDQKRKVLFGSKLRVQIPGLVPSGPAEFGTKTRSSRAPPCVPTAERSPRAIGSVDQHSEDYTRVICHGPSPRTTHIFDNCVVENYNCGLTASSNKITELPRGGSDNSRRPRSFLSFCDTCDKNLQQKIDIFIYRGEKAFCSRECRHHEMVLDGIENGDFDDHFY